MNSAWYRAPFVLVLTVKKRTFYKHAVQEQTRENVAFIWGHVHLSIAALWTAVSA